MTQNTFYHTPILDHAAVVQGMLERLSKSQAEAHRALWPEMYRALDEAEAAVICDTDFSEADCASGDMHELPRLLSALEIQMYDSCLGSVSPAEAGCIVVAMEEEGVWLTPVDCNFCKRTHLVRGR